MPFQLRNLIQFLDNNDEKQNIIITNLADEIIQKQEGKPLDIAFDFQDYRNKVSSYINEHMNITSIYKLTHNIPLYKEDYEELERILTVELGSKEDYKNEFGETPFGILIRKFAKMNHQAIMQSFSKFINDEALNSKQIDFIKKIINYIEQNGYMDSSVLQKPPFDKPVNFIKLFDAKTRSDIIETISDLKENAINIIA